jgi:hypothetical protein
MNILVDDLGTLVVVSIILTSLGVSPSPSRCSGSPYTFFVFNLKSHKIAGSLNLKLFIINSVVITEHVKKGLITHCSFEVCTVQ